MPWMIVVILLTLLDKLSSDVACIRLADIYWNVTNPIFRIDNTDHIIDVNKGNGPFEYDQVNIICPVNQNRNIGTDAVEGDDGDTETYIIYNVSKDEYDSCRITNPNPKIIAVCDKPHQLMYFTITFRSFTPQPGGLEFLPGHDYYFLSTSTGRPEGLNQMVGGRCATHNMKVIFKVCCSPDKNPSSSSGSKSNRGSIPESPVSPSGVTTEPEKAISPTTSESSNPYHHRNRNLPFPPRHQPYPMSTSTMSSTSTVSNYTSRWNRRPLYPARVTPSSTKLQINFEEMPIEDEMVRSHDGTRDQLPNKARSKNEGVQSGGSSSSSSTNDSPSRTLLQNCCHHWVTGSLVFQLLLSQLWR